MKVILIAQLDHLILYRTDRNIQRLGQVFNADGLARHEEDRLDTSGQRARRILGFLEQLLFDFDVAFKIRHAFSSGFSSRRPGYRTISP